MAKKNTEQNPFERVHARIDELIKERADELATAETEVLRLESEIQEIAKAKEAAKLSGDFDEYREAVRKEEQDRVALDFYKTRSERTNLNYLCSDEENAEIIQEILDYITQKEAETIEKIRPLLQSVISELAAYQKEINDANDLLLEWHRKIHQYKPARGQMPDEPAKSKNYSLCQLLTRLSRDFTIKTEILPGGEDQRKQARRVWVG